MGMNMKFLIFVFPVMYDSSITYVNFILYGVRILMTSEYMRLKSIRVPLCTY